MNHRGFTLIELLIVSAILLAVTATIALLASPIHAVINRTAAESDLVGRARLALSTVVDDLQQAGNGVALGAPTSILHERWPAFSSHRSLDDATSDPPCTAVSITRVLSNAQGVLADDLAEDSTTIHLESAPCAMQDATCGFDVGDFAIVFDGTTSRSVTLVGVDPITRTLTVRAAIGAAFARGSVVTAVEHVSYGLRLASDGSRTLVRLTSGGVEQPVADHVTDFVVSGLEATLPASGVQRVDLTLRLETASAEFRGAAGSLFRRGGVARNARAWVPDVELRTTVAIRLW
jgi:prepilin-type N-terminal cleavage/methylation domain-containing protein